MADLYENPMGLMGFEFIEFASPQPGLLEQVFTPDQYAVNVETVPSSGARVEFAIRLPGQGKRGSDSRPVWLPIDAKFPIEDYQRLIDAGHAYASILNYTLAQVDAFIAAIDRQESRRLANLLSVVSVGAQGSSDAIKKFMRRLDA